MQSAGVDRERMAIDVRLSVAHEDNLQRHRNRLYLRVRFNTLAGILPPPARLLVASERHRVIQPHASIDPYGAGFDPVRELVSQTDVARPDAR
jgi:hypothetical protein